VRVSIARPAHAVCVAGHIATACGYPFVVGDL